MVMYFTIRYLGTKKRQVATAGSSTNPWMTKLTYLFPSIEADPSDRPQYTAWDANLQRETDHTGMKLWFKCD